MFEELIRAWDGEEVVVHYDAAAEAWMFVGVHSTRLGPAAGGTRMKAYGSPAEGLRDVLRLSSAMTRKLAACGLPYGGGKAVLAVPAIPTGEARRCLLERYGRLVDSLHGTYLTAPDVNTNQADMDTIGRVTRHVFGRSPEAGGSGSTAPATAVGVFHAIRACLREAFGDASIEGRPVLVQGAGEVGRRLVELLAAANARVLVSDVDGERVREVCARWDATPVPAAEALTTACDVLSPCALGGVLTAETIPALRCRVVAGAANNQLGDDGDGELFAARGILYAPDYVANAGGVIHGLCREALGWPERQVDERLAGIAETLATVFEVARERGTSTERAAEELVARRLSGGV